MIIFFSVEHYANISHNNEEGLVDNDEILDELEPGETEVPGYVDYRDLPHIPPQLTSAQENEIAEKFKRLLTFPLQGYTKICSTCFLALGIYPYDCMNGFE